MEFVAINVVAVLVLIPFVYWLGCMHGILYKQAIDAPSNALTLSQTAELYEKEDPKVNVLLYVQMDSTLSSYEDYINNGIPIIAKIFLRSAYIKHSNEYLSRVAEFIHSTNDGMNKYKQRVAERLVRLGYEKP